MSKDPDFIREQHYRERCHDLQAEVKALEADLAVSEANYGTLLQRWKDTCQDLAIFRAENQRLKDLTGD